ncbi:MAG: RimJ/RimL family protein N-acetyltransferase [Crocinitomix sp.]|jgi:RimJ/RimL family protein N-acetyltransferase
MEKLNFKKGHVLENEVVQLRPLLPTDLDELMVFAMNEPTLWDYSLTPADGKENMTEYLKLAIEDRTHEKSYPFIVFDKRKKKYAGSTRFYDYNTVHNTTQLGYTWYGSEFHGTGLNKNCKYLLLEFAFETLGLDRVEFRADNENAHSIAAMKSLGCTFEGVLRSNCASPAGRRNSIVLSILKNEWFDTIKATLKKKCIEENERYLNA